MKVGEERTGGNQKRGREWVREEGKRGSTYSDSRLYARPWLPSDVPAPSYIIRKHKEGKQGCSDRPCSRADFLGRVPRPGESIPFSRCGQWHC